MLLFILAPNAGNIHRKHHVFKRRQVCKKIEILENNADTVAPEIVLVDFFNILRFVVNRTRCWGRKPGKQGKQSRLSRAGFPDN